VLQVFARAAAASTSCPAASSNACWPPAARGDIIFSGVGKTRARCARRSKSASLLQRRERSRARGAERSRRAAARRAGQPARQPDVDPQTHPYISTGLKGNKFGIAHEDALHAYQRAAALPGLQVVGIDCHIGSQITEVALPRRDGPRAGPGRARRGGRHPLHTSTSAAAWASPTTASSRPRPTRCGSACWRGWTRAASATAS
jgi:hypothetical protein